MVMDTTETLKKNLDLSDQSVCVVVMRFYDGCAAMVGFLAWVFSYGFLRRGATRDCLEMVW